MRKPLVVLVAGLLLTLGSTAHATEFSSCWVTSRIDPISLEQIQVTRCRISGGSIVDYASDSAVPSQLSPQTGSDLTGQCWYYTSASTQYVILNQYANGDADIGFDTDPGNPGGIVAIGPTLPRCTSEPVATEDPTADVWRYVTQYIHAPPTPDLNPKPGDGVTGLDTYVGLPIPADHNARISSGATTLDVYIEVTTVIIRWGDGEIDTYPATNAALAGYPDGVATHTFGTKNDDGVNLAVSYDWTARWRVVGGSWEFLAVPNTTTTVLYPISEIVSVLTG